MRADREAGRGERISTGPQRAHNLKELAMDAGAKVARELQAGDAMAKLDPTWNECGIEEKINKLRSALLTLASQGQQAGSQAHEALKVAKAHQHGARGEVVLPVIESGVNLMVREYSQHPFDYIRRMLS